jgi:hypothetical protein
MSGDTRRIVDADTDQEVLDRLSAELQRRLPAEVHADPLRANIRETADPFEISVQGGEAKAA